MFEAPITPVEDEVDGDEAEEDEVHPDHPVVIVKRLVDDAENVAEFDEDHEEQALPLGGFRPDRLENRERPGKPEAEQHQKFENTHDLITPFR